MMTTLLILIASLQPTSYPLSVLGRESLTCPVCDQAFQTVVSSQRNSRDGVDRDLFARAVGPQPVYYHISTCPQCGYSGYLTDFAAETLISDSLREKILQSPGLSLPEGFNPKSDPRDLDASDRYALAVTCYQWQNKSDEALAWLYLRASWVQRDKGSLVPPTDLLVGVMSYIERWRPPLPTGGNQVDVEMALATRITEALTVGHFDQDQSPYAELALALILRRHGENRLANPILDQLATQEALPERVRSSIQRMRASIDKERALQTQAADHFQRALEADRVAPANRGSASYVLAELLRHLGRDDEAVRWYDDAMSNHALPSQLRTWAGQQKSWALATDAGKNG